MPGPSDATARSLDDAAPLGALPAPPPGRLVRRSTPDLVAEHVRRMIFDGLLRSGDRVPLDAIAADLGVSRLPVREALLGMERDGLVVSEPHVGTFVAPFDAGTVRDHFEIAGLLQGLAAERVALRADPADLALLEHVAGAVHGATDADAAFDASMEFHRVLNRLGGSARQRSVLRVMSRMLPTRFFVEVPGADDAARAGTDGILDAVRSGDPLAVRRTCLEVALERAELVIRHQRDRGVFPHDDAATSPPPPRRAR